jgi:hypothetical protein
MPRLPLRRERGFTPAVATASLVTLAAREAARSTASLAEFRVDLGVWVFCTDVVAFSSPRAWVSSAVDVRWPWSGSRSGWILR